MQRGNVRIDNSTVLNGTLFVAVDDRTRRALPKRHGRWHTVYTRMNHCAKAGVLDGAFEESQVLTLPRVRIGALEPDSTSANGAPGWHGSAEKGSPKPSAGAAGLNTKVHLAAAGVKHVHGFALTPGQEHDALAGRALLKRSGPDNPQAPLIMERAFDRQPNSVAGPSQGPGAGRAAALHWLPPDEAFRLATDALRPGGTLAILKHDRPPPLTGFRRRAQTVYLQVFPDRPGLDQAPSSEDRIAEFTRRFEAQPRFGLVHVHNPNAGHAPTTETTTRARHAPTPTAARCHPNDGKCSESG